MTWDIAGKRVLITGATTGIGAATGAELARRGARVTVLGRSPSRLQALPFAEATHVVDLADLSSVRSVIARIQGTPIDVLINNAGVAGVTGLTADGFEMHFATNYLGHALLTTEMMPDVSEGGRIINLTSAAHFQVKEWDWDALHKRARGTARLRAYAVSKLCNILFTRACAERYIHVDSVAVHPGLVASEIWRTVPSMVRPLVTRSMKTPEEGSRTTVMCATTGTLESGGYYPDLRVADPSRLARDAALASELWDRTEQYFNQ